MPNPSDIILLVTPVWRDSSRLAGFGKELALALASSPLPVRWVVADDGSGEKELTSLGILTEGFHKVFPDVRLHSATRHFGKGSVVREAWALEPACAWLAFVDADGSVAPQELLRLIDTALAADKSALGIRKRTETTLLEESPWRGLFHRGFLIAARLVLGLRCEDPQCGAKVLRGVDYRSIAAGLRENGLAFDSELLFALKNSGADWLEIPVNWIEKKGGKVRPLRDGFGMLAALFRIRRESGS